MQKWAGHLAGLRSFVHGSDAGGVVFVCGTQLRISTLKNILTALKYMGSPVIAEKQCFAAHIKALDEFEVPKDVIWNLKAGKGKNYGK